MGNTVRSCLWLLCLLTIILPLYPLSAWCVFSWATSDVWRLSRRVPPGWSWQGVQHEDLLYPASEAPTCCGPP